MIPVIVINFNKLEVLKRSLSSFVGLGDVDIIIVDNGSDYEPLLRFYDSCSFKVIRFGKISSPDELPINVNAVLRSINYNYDYYVVTDSDIEIENPEGLLSVFISLLEEYDVEMVSPMLRINDLPKNKYTEEQIGFHVEQFYSKPIIKLKEGISGIRSIVDTTFALYKKGYVFKRFSQGFRLFEPFMAKHLDWYDDLGSLSEEKKHFLRSASCVSTAKGHILNHYPEFKK